MNTLINETVVHVINQNGLSGSKIRNLISIKEFADRISGYPYLHESRKKELAAKFGEAPRIQTWGDYIQSELAADASFYSDDEFSRVVDTVRFDLMSAWEIFSTNGVDFFEWVDSSAEGLFSTEREYFNEEEQEIIHLSILKEYYTSMGLVDAFTDEERAWFDSFAEEECVVSY